MEEREDTRIIDDVAYLRDDIRTHRFESEVDDMVDRLRQESRVRE